MRRFELHVRQLNATRVELDELLVELSALEKNLTMARALLASLRQLPYDDARALNISKLIAEVRDELLLSSSELVVRLFNVRSNRGLPDFGE